MSIEDGNVVAFIAPDTFLIEMAGTMFACEWDAVKSTCDGDVIFADENVRKTSSRERTPDAISYSLAMFLGRIARWLRKRARRSGCREPRPAP